MSKMTEEVTRAIATKFLTHPEEFKFTKLENYKNYVVYFAAYKPANGNTNYGRPIYILIDKLGKARYATYEENHEILMRSNPTEERLRRKRMKRLKRLRRKRRMRKRTSRITTYVS